MRFQISAPILAVVLALMLFGSSSSSASRVAPGTNPLTYGVLASLCDPARVAAERRAGIQTVTLGMVWALYEPEQEQFDTDYVSAIQRKVSVCRRAGLQIVLSPGLQYPPAWVGRLDAGKYLDQYGNPPLHGEVNLVFSQAVRESAAAYLRRMSTDIGFDNFAAIRVGTSRTGELGYPGPVDGADQGQHDFWAFDSAAQSGDGLAAGLSPTPLPGWVPGMTEWRRQPVTVEQTTEWFRWYQRCLVATASWQADLLITLGFAGGFHVPVAGRGALPEDLLSALSAHLDGRGDPDGALERGLNYPDQFAQLAGLDARLTTQNARARLVVDFAGLDDNTAVRARAAYPPQDSCQPGDTQRLLTGTSVDRWSAQRWMIANARLAHLQMVGENPGPPNAQDTGGSPDSDSELQQMTEAIAYARGCHLSGFLWAFENDLFAQNPVIGIDAYARAIADGEVP